MLRQAFLRLRRRGSAEVEREWKGLYLLSGSRVGKPARKPLSKQRSGDMPVVVILLLLIIGIPLLALCAIAFGLAGA